MQSTSGKFVMPLRNHSSGLLLQVHCLYKLDYSMFFSSIRNKVIIIVISYLHIFLHWNVFPFFPFNPCINELVFRLRYIKLGAALREMWSYVTFSTWRNEYFYFCRIFLFCCLVLSHYYYAISIIKKVLLYIHFTPSYTMQAILIWFILNAYPS